MPKIRATDGVRVIDDPSEEQLHDLLADMNLSCNFVIVERLDSNPVADYHDFIQVMLNADPSHGSYLVEYRDGGPTAHFQTTVLRESSWDSPFDPGFDQVVRVICDWAAGNQAWLSALPWKPLDLSGVQQP
ncbi:hypothetical protein F66182_13786 [Fusarium sp. NRRL 66182]|nr:hypothetical protein F66182_13786 [Fusarium sp. NRRL 66182]